MSAQGVSTQGGVCPEADTLPPDPEADTPRRSPLKRAVCILMECIFVDTIFGHLDVGFHNEYTFVWSRLLLEPTGLASGGQTWSAPGRGDPKS